MSTEIALSVDGMNLADAMGFTATTTPQSNLWRVSTVVKQGVDGNKVVNTPMFRLRRRQYWHRTLMETLRIH